DDSVEVRERAKGDLIRLGASALGAMRKHLVSTDPSVREDLKSVIARIELEITLNQYKGSPSLITLKGEQLSLKQILESIGKQSRTPVIADSISAGDLITIELDRV